VDELGERCPCALCGGMPGTWKAQAAERVGGGCGAVEEKAVIGTPGEISAMGRGCGSLCPGAVAAHRRKLTSKADDVDLDWADSMVLRTRDRGQKRWQSVENPNGQRSNRITAPRDDG
jgi:hypothetical protein